MKHSAPLYLLAGLIPLVLAATVPRIFPEGIKTDTIVGISGVTPPGMVPIGGMVAVMPSTHASAWQPPAPEQCKDGFTRADGHVVDLSDVNCSGAVITGTMPNMTAKYPRGNGSGVSGDMSGSNTATVTYTSASAAAQVFRGTSSTYTVSVPGHYHGLGAGSGLTAAAQIFTGSSASTNNPTAGSSLASHGHYIQSNSASIGPGTNDFGFGPNRTTSSGPIGGASGVTHVHTFTATGTNAASSVSGTVGLVNGGQDGNGSISASGSNTPAGTNDASAVVISGLSMNSGSNEPAYVEVVWVIRVK